MECSACGSSMRNEARVCLACGEIVRKKVAASDRLTAVPAGVPHWIAFDAPPAGQALFYPASRIQRTFAVLVDVVILGLVGYLFGAATGGEPARLNANGTVSYDLWLLIPLLAFNALYAIVFPATAWQGTPGKKLIGLRIVTPEHEQISIFQSTARWGCQLVCFGVVFPLAAMVALVGCIAVPIAFLILMGNGRSPWDAMAGTQVVD